MATNVTYFVALTTIRDYAVEHGFEDKTILDKVQNIINSKAPKSASGEKSQARKDNEDVARDLVNAMHDAGVTTIQNKWVRENFNSAFKPAKVTAILNVACEIGLLTREIVPASASRNELFYHLA